jgi:hypothetical protein
MDVARGATPLNPTPNELAAWCDCVGAELPRAFVTRLREEKPKQKRKSQAIKRIPYPSWLPQALALPSQPIHKKKSGRPRLNSSLADQLVNDAKHIQERAAKTGTDKTIPEIAKELGKRAEYCHWETSTIERKLNGQIPWIKNRSISGGKRLTKTK